MKRALLAIFSFVFVFTASAEPVANAENRGTDPWAEIVNPAIQGGLSHKYPISSYDLDYYIDQGIIPDASLGAEVAQFMTNLIWNFLVWIVVIVSELFTWAFSLDLLNGPHGALRPVVTVMQKIHTDVLGEQFWFLALALTAGWVIYQAIRSHTTRAIMGLVTSVVFMVIAMFFLTKSMETYGPATQAVNSVSSSMLAGVRQGSLDNQDEAKRLARDQIFETWVLKPWAILQFGGLVRCVDTDKIDSDGYPDPVSPVNKARDVCHDVLKQGRDGHGGYAQRFLAQAPGSDERKAEYEALRDGEVDLPTPRRGDSNAEERAQFANYAVDKTDSPAVDMMQEAASYKRLVLVVFFGLGIIFFLLLFARISLAVILLGAVSLILIGLTPIAFLAAAMPFERSHALFRKWLSMLAVCLVAKIVFSFFVSLMLVVTAAVLSASVVMGFLPAFLINGVMWAMIYKNRRAISSWMGSQSNTIEGKLPAIAGKHSNKVGTIITAGVSGGVGAVIGNLKAKEEVQETAKAPTTSPPVDAPPIDDKPTAPIPSFEGSTTTPNIEVVHNIAGSHETRYVNGQHVTTKL